MRTRSGKNISLLPVEKPTSYNKKRRRSPPEEHSNEGWSSLPDDLLGLILQRLALTDYVRFGTVCRSWIRVFAERGQPPALDQQPWLWFPEKGNRFYCLSERRWYRHLNLPSYLMDCHCLGSQHGWLIFVTRSKSRHHYTPFLVNPFSGAQIQLHPFPACGAIVPFHGGEKFYCSLPPDDPQCTFVYISFYGSMLVSSLQSTWRTISWFRAPYTAAIFYRGSLYAATYRGELCLVKLDDSELGYSVETILAPSGLNEFMLAVKPDLPLIEHDGELIMCCLGIARCGGVSRNSHTFKIFKANLDLRRWEATEILGPKRLIIGDYWVDFMPMLKKQIKSSVERFVEIDSRKSLYHFVYPYSEVLFSPRLC